MKLFYGMKDIQEMYYDNLTEEEIDELERQGTDVSEIRANFYKRKEELEKIGTTDITMLEKYERTPRDTETEFFKSVSGRPPLFFGKEKHIDKYVNSKIVYPVVVQASPVLYRPGNNPAAAVVVLIARDKKHAKDFEFLYKLRDLLIAMRDEEVEVPKSCSKLVKKLNDPKSYIDEKIQGETINEIFADADLWIKVIYISQKDLPGSMIPNNDILPSLCIEGSNENFSLELINGKFYKK